MVSRLNKIHINYNLQTMDYRLLSLKAFELEIGKLYVLIIS